MHVLSLGGSILVPEKVDYTYLKKFTTFLDEQSVIIVGGGSVARAYQHITASSDALDWIGIRATHLNAELVRAAFGKRAHSSVLHAPKKVNTTKHVIAGGWKPGWTTDYVAVQFAIKYGVKTVYNLTKQDYIYTKDPKKKGARPIEHITWKEFFKHFSYEHKPGMHFPFDPKASKLAQKKGIRVISINGRKLKNLRNAFQGKAFIGTIID